MRAAVILVCQTLPVDVVSVTLLLQEWATVLASPHVLRLADACSTAEDAALGAALSGKGTSYVNKAVDVCMTAIHGWEHAPVQVRQAGLVATCCSKLRWVVDENAVVSGGGLIGPVGWAVRGV